MYYIGLDVHKKTISYCVKDAAGRVHQEGKIGSTRCELDAWIRTLPQPRMMAMEATIFTGWIYDHLLPHAEKVKVAHPLMLRAIAAAKKKNDTIDARKIADCLRCDLLPECHMASTEIRDRRRTLRYRNLVLRQTVQMKNRVSGLLMETGVSYNKQRLHKMGYFAELMSTNEEVSESIRPLLSLCREHIDRSIRADYGSAQFAGTGSAAGRSAATLEDCSRRWSDHRSDLGSGDRRLHPLPQHQAGHQLLRAVQCGEEFGRQGDAYADLQAAQQAHPASAGGGSQAGAALSATSWHCFTNESGSEATAIGPPWQWPGKWSCYMLAVERRRRRLRACRRVQADRGSVKHFPNKEKQKQGSIDAQAARSRRSPPGRRRRLPRLSSNCFGTGREHKLNLLRQLFGA